MIQPEEVKRDPDGYWTHSQYPDFDDREYVPKEEWEQWCADNQIKSVCVWFEYDAPEEIQDNRLNENEYGCEGWEPTKPAENAFLLSIHDTEDCPVAIFAIPLEHHEQGEDWGCGFIPPAS